MEVKLNIANILKDKPSGTKLYADAFGELKLECIKVNDVNAIYVKNKALMLHIFYSDGRYNRYGEPILVPSEKMRDWNKFAWKTGDILVSDDGKSHIIFSRWYDDNYTSFYGKHYLNKENKDNTIYYGILTGITEKFSLEDKDAAKTYINTIEEKFSGKLNLKTLKIEKTQLEFKDGDIVVSDAAPSLCYSKCIFILKGDLHTSDTYVKSYIFYNVNNNKVYFDEIDISTREPNIRLATDEEKQQLFDTLAKKNKAWNAEKKVVEDIKTEYQFKPFEKVLVRNYEDTAWRAGLFSHIREDDKRYVTSCLTWKYCIPYEGNESLLGTTKNVKNNYE